MKEKRQINIIILTIFTILTRRKCLGLESMFGICIQSLLSIKRFNPFINFNDISDFTFYIQINELVSPFHQKI